MSHVSQTEHVWEFTFMVVQAAETYEAALEAAHDYLAEYADKRELEPVQSRIIE
jgi:hypothetical protein